MRAEDERDILASIIGEQAGGVERDLLPVACGIGIAGDLHLSDAVAAAVEQRDGEGVGATVRGAVGITVPPVVYAEG